MPHHFTAHEVAEMPIGEAVLQIRSGLAPNTFDRVAKTLSINPEVLAIKLGISPRTLRYQKGRKSNLSKDITEKVVRLARVQSLARRIFTGDDAVSQWLSQAAPALDGAAPLDLLDTELGAREVEAVLNGLAYGNIM